MHFKIDKELVAQRFSRSLDTYEDNAIVQREMADTLIMMLSNTGHTSYSNCLEIGAGTGLLSRSLINHFIFNNLYINDLVKTFDTSKFPGNNIIEAWGDIETLQFNTLFDLIISGATLQWIEDKSAFIYKLRQMLSPKGILAFSTFGPANFQEIRTLTNQGLTYPTLDKWEEMLEGFTIKSAETYQRTLYFESPSLVLAHMRDTGVNGLTRSKMSRFELRRLIDGYEQFKTPHGYALTYEPLIIVAKKEA